MVLYHAVYNLTRTALIAVTIRMIVYFRIFVHTCSPTRDMWCLPALAIIASRAVECQRLQDLWHSQSENSDETANTHEENETIASKEIGHTSKNTPGGHSAEDAAAATAFDLLTAQLKASVRRKRSIAQSLLVADCKWLPVHKTYSSNSQHRRWDQGACGTGSIECYE